MSKTFLVLYNGGIIINVQPIMIYDGYFFEIYFHLLLNYTKHFLWYEVQSSD